MEIKNIRTFLRYSELESSTKVSEALGYTRGAVSAQIRQLEKETGVPLLERKGKKTVLTGYGKRFLPYAREIERAHAEADNFIHKGLVRTGILRIGMTEAMNPLLKPAGLGRFREEWPDLRIEIGHYENTGILYQQLDAGELDMILFLDNRRSFGEHVSLYRKAEPIVFSAAAKTRSGKPDILGRNEISQSVLVVNSEIRCGKDPLLVRWLEHQLGRQEAENSISMICGDCRTVQRLAEEGSCIAFSPYFAVKEAVDRGTLVILPSELPELTVSIQLVGRKNVYIQPQMKSFVKCMFS
ncbi:MAG: LysR family transcriptional regulator [Lachnospiraceae bacterium]|nr:LysR family transcriptional regulator [Lachnospiraceae bacterium]